MPATEKQLTTLQRANIRTLELKQKDMERQAIKYYTQSLKDIKGQIAIYESNGYLTKAEMYKYNRLATLEDSIAKEISKLNGKNSRSLKNGLRELYEESYYRTAFVMEKGVGAKLSYGMINPKVLENVIKNPLDRIGLAGRTRENHAKMLKQVKEQLALGLNQGRGYREIAQAIEKRVKVGETNMLTVVRTEAHRVKEQGNKDSQEYAANKGVELKRRWVATLDSNTRDSHGNVDGKEVGVDEPFNVNGSELMYPGDSAGPPEEVINCRCIVISVIAGFEPTKRRVQGEDVIPYTNYNDWDKARNEGG